MKSLRVDRNSVISFMLIAPSTAFYYKHQLEELQQALIEQGHKVVLVLYDIDTTLVSQIIQKNSIDVVLQVNALRNRFLDLPQNVIFISWFQDIFPGDESFIDENIADDNFIITLGDPEILGFRKRPKKFLGTFYSGVSDRNLSIYSPQNKYIYEGSLCGFIPNFTKKIRNSNLTYNTIQKIPYPLSTICKTLVNGSPLDQSYFFNTMRSITDMNYTPLSGDLSMNKIETAIRSHLNFYDNFKFTSWYETKFIMPSRTPGFHGIMNIERFLKERALFFFAQTYPRYADRTKLFDLIEQFNPNFKVFGSNWNKYESFVNNWGGVIQTKGALWDLYKNSKVNYSNNTHGLGLHSRVLECMASGGLVAMHQSKRDHLDGGILSSFQEEEHFLFYDNLSFMDLVNNKAFHHKITKNAFEIVKEKHTWSCSAKHLVSMVNNKFQSNL